MRFLVLRSLVLGCLSVFVSYGLSAQPRTEDSTVVGEWQVGVYEFPPFMMKNSDDEWEGVSVELWQDLVDSLDIVYQFQEIRQGQATDLITNGSLDAILLLPVSSEAPVQFSHIYHTSMLGIATAQTQSLSSIVKGLFTMRFLRIVVMLSVLLLIVGTIMWFLERKTNEDNFGGERNPVQGIGSGFWWAGVTMTTIGYGDKAPVTFWGRAVALLWMLIAMAVTASLTAALVSVVGGGTAQSVKVPDGLRKKQVGAVADSPFGKYLKHQNVTFESYDSVEEGLKDVADQEINIFVHNTPTLRYWLNENTNLAVQVANAEVLPQRYAMAFPVRNDNATRLNIPLLKIINQPDWRDRINRHMPK